MPTSTVHVQRSDGSPVRGARVILGFDGGHTHEALTDAGGEAAIEHASSGRATIYVDGKNRGSLHAPGAASVTL